MSFLNSVTLTDSGQPFRSIEVTKIPLLTLQPFRIAHFCKEKQKGGLVRYHPYCIINQTKHLHDLTYLPMISRRYETNRHATATISQLSKQNLRVPLVRNMKSPEDEPPYWRTMKELARYFDPFICLSEARAFTLTYRRARVIPNVVVVVCCRGTSGPREKSKNAWRTTLTSSSANSSEDGFLFTTRHYTLISI